MESLDVNVISLKFKFIAVNMAEFDITCILYNFRQGEPANGNEYGPLTDIPDWSYAGNLM